MIVSLTQSLPPSYKNFVMNYNMQGMDKTIPELFAMLKAAEVEIKKEHQVLMVNKTTSFKKKGKGKKGNFKKNVKQVVAQVKKPMSGYNNHLFQLGVELLDDCVIDRILQSLPPRYKSFVMNYNMQGMDKTIPELFAMLQL